MVVSMASGCWLIPQQAPAPVPTPSALVSESPSPSESASPSPSASPTTKPKPTSPPVAAKPSCKSFLDAATLADYGSRPNWTLTKPSSFAKKLHDEGDPLAAFDTYGGVLCQWGYKNSDIVEMYAYSPISSSNATKQKTKLLNAGASAETHAGGQLFHVGADTVDEAWYYFESGFWLWSYPDAARIDEILGHLPAL
jgi:hypothetical protein